MQSTTRPFTKDSDQLLVMLHNEGYCLERMSTILHRDITAVRQRLILLFNNGQADKIHEFLMLCNGLYAREMRKKKLPPFLKLKEDITNE